jgi:hypothetical protein
MDTGRRPVRQLLLICKRRLGVAGKRGCGRLSEPEKKYSGLARSRSAGVARRCQAPLFGFALKPPRFQLPELWNEEWECSLFVEAQTDDGPFSITSDVQHCLEWVQCLETSEKKL